jgi:hypothetical protein
MDRYLKRKISSMKEHEYGILLYSLAKFGFLWPGAAAAAATAARPEYSADISSDYSGSGAADQRPSGAVIDILIRDKIESRLPRVKGFLSPRSVCRAVWSLAAMGAPWNAFSTDTKDALMESICRALGQDESKPQQQQQQQRRDDSSVTVAKEANDAVASRVPLDNIDEMMDPFSVNHANNECYKYFSLSEILIVAWSLEKLGIKMAGYDGNDDKKEPLISMFIDVLDVYIQTIKENESHIV